MHDDRESPPPIDADHRRLVRSAARLLGRAEAEDAVQDAYVRALETASRQELNAAQAWLMTVVRNLAVDRLRRRQWMARWLADVASGDTASPTSPSAEMDAALAQEVAHALRLVAAHLTPAEGALVMLHEVFEIDHAEIAKAAGKSEAGNRQRLRRALQRIREAGRAPAASRSQPELDAAEEAVFRLHLQALQWRDPTALWAMLRQPGIRALAEMRPVPAKAMSPSASPEATSSIVQLGGQLGLVLTLDGVTLCVVPLGVRAEHDAETAPV